MTTAISLLAGQLDELLPDDGPTGLCAQADGERIKLGDDWATVWLTEAQARGLVVMLGENEWNCYEIWEFVAKHFGV